MKLREINPHNKNYPSYIYKIKDINVLESKKRAFRKAAESFEINKFDKLCYRLVDKEEVNDSFESNEENLFIKNIPIFILQKTNYKLLVLNYLI